MEVEFEYSPEGKAARDLFTSEYTSYLFYVEDTGAEIFYERLLERILPKLTGFEVVCLHGKSNLKKKVKEARVPGLTYVFIVDKDFDDLLGPPQDDEFVYLERYSIENYLADLRALVKVYMEEFTPAKSAQKVLQDCADYEEYRTALEERLIRMTRYFVVVRRLWIELQTSKTSIQELLKGGNEFHPMPQEEWIQEYRGKVLEESGLTAPDLDAELAKALVPFPDYPEPTTTDLWHVPGKLLFACVLKFVAKRTDVQLETKLGHGLYTRVLNHIPTSEFAQLRTRLTNRHGSLLQFI